MKEYNNRTSRKTGLLDENCSLYTHLYINMKEAQKKINPSSIKCNKFFNYRLEIMTVMVNGSDFLLIYQL